MVRTGLNVKPGTVVIPFSALTKQGREEIWEQMEALLGDNGQTLAENALLITREELYGAVDSAGERQLLPLGEMR